MFIPANNLSIEFNNKGIRVTNDDGELLASWDNPIEVEDSAFRYECSTVFHEPHFKQNMVMVKAPYGIFSVLYWPGKHGLAVFKEEADSDIIVISL